MMYRFLLLFLLGSWSLQAQEKDIRIVIQVGHQVQVTALSRNSNTNLLASGDGDGRIKVWDLPSSRLLHDFPFGHRGAISDLLFHPTKPILFSASLDHSILGWDLSSNQQLVRLDGGKDKVTALASYANGRFLYSISRNGELKFWDWEKEELLDGYSLELDEVIEKAYFYPAQNLLLIGTLQGSLLVWDLHHKKVVQQKKIASHAISSLCLSPDGSTIFLTSHGNQAQLLRLHDLSLIRSLTDLTAWGFVFDAVFAADGSKVAVAGTQIPNNGLTMVWDTQSGAVLHNGTGISFAYHSVEFSPDGNDIILGSSTGSVYAISTKDYNPSHFYGVNIEAFQQVNFNADGSKVILRGENDKYWDLKTGTLEYSDQPEAVEDQSILVPEGLNEMLAASRDHQYFVVRNEESSKDHLELWSTKSGERIKTLKGHKHEVYFAAFDQKGKRLITAAEKGNDFYLWSPVYSEIICWNLETNKKVKKYSLPSNVKLKATAPDHQYLAAIRDYTDVVLYKSSTGKKVYEFPGQSPVLINETGIKEPTISSVHHTSWVDQLRFCTNGKYLVATYSNGWIRIWEVATGEEKYALNNHQNIVYDFDMSPDEKYFVASAYDRVILWDLSQYTFNLFFLITSHYLATLVSLTGEENGYIVHTDGNFYMANKNGLDAVHFVIDQQAYQFDQFDLYYNRPHEVIKNFPYSDPLVVKRYEAAFQMNLKANNASMEDLNPQPNTPVLEIENLAALSSVQYQREVELVVNIRDSLFDLQQIRLYVNRVLTPQHFEKELHGERAVQLRIPLYLSDGTNRIQLEVVNTNNVRSLKSSFEIQYEGPPAQVNYYLVAIGTAQYSDSINFPRLQYPVRDAQGLVNAFREKKTSAHTLLLTDQHFSTHTLDSITTFLAPTRPSDVVLFFISGHGILYNNTTYYYCTHATKATNPTEEGIPFRVFENLLAQSNSRKKLLLINSCFSGKVSRASTYEEQQAFELSQQIFVNYHSSEGSSIISSSEGNDFTKELRGTRIQNGMMAGAIIKALKQEGSFTVSGLHQFIDQEIAAFPPLLRRTKPVLRVENLLNDFELW